MTYNTDETVQNPTYKPMNVHPNPYGNGVTPDVMSTRTCSTTTFIRWPKRMLTIRTNFLPSYDIPMDSVSYQNDERIRQITYQNLN